MDDSTSRPITGYQDTSGPPVDNTSCRKKRRIPFGMNTFDAEAQETFGNELRVFMSFKDGSAIHPESDHPEKTMPDEPTAIARRLKQLGQEITSGMADQLELLVRYDQMEGWKSSGSRHCVAWMNMELGISPRLGILASGTQAAHLTHHSSAVQRRNAHPVDNTAAFTRCRPGK